MTRQVLEAMIEGLASIESPSTRLWALDEHIDTEYDVEETDLEDLIGEGDSFDVFFTENAILVEDANDPTRASVFFVGDDWLLGKSRVEYTGESPQEVFTLLAEGHDHTGLPVLALDPYDLEDSTQDPSRGYLFPISEDPSTNESMIEGYINDTFEGYQTFEPFWGEFPQDFRGRAVDIITKSILESRPLRPEDMEETYEPRTLHAKVRSELALANHMEEEAFKSAFPEAGTNVPLSRLLMPVREQREMELDQVVRTLSDMLEEDLF